MFELKEMCRVDSLDQADHLLNEDKKNVILGGLLWMRMGTRQFNTGIDLTGLGLDQIQETEDAVEIGAMTRLRQIETSTLLEQHFGPILRQAVANIVGVQFRNLATIGGSVFSRFSFSDPTCALMVLDTQVHLHRAGQVSLADFLENSPGRDILVKLSIPKKKRHTSYQSVRMSATDFPVLAAAFSRSDDTWQIAYGARPSRAKLAPKAAQTLSHTPDADQIQAAAQALGTELKFGTNNRGSQAYRELLAPVLLKRGINAVCS